MCFAQNVVYNVRCARCKKEYIGSTIRHLHTRIKEHLTSRVSAVYTHAQQCSGQFTVRILARARDETDLRIKEAIYITRNLPELNQKEEMLDVVAWTAGVTSILY